MCLQAGAPRRKEQGRRRVVSEPSPRTSPKGRGRNALSQLPWRAVRATDPLRRFGVAGDLLGGRVPGDFAAQAEGDVAEVADGGGAMADLHIGNRRFAGFDAVQEVLVVVGALVKVRVARSERLFQDVRGVAGDL